MDFNTTDQEEVDRLMGVVSNIRVSYIWVVFVLGYPTNFFSIVTILTMRTLTPATFYVAMLALCDGLALQAKLIGHQMTLNKAYVGTVGCKLEFVAGYISAVANWMLVFICAERCVAVCLPLKRHLIFTKWRAFISTIVLALSLLVLYATMHGVMRDSDDSGLLCGTMNEYLHFWINGWYWIDVCLQFFIPLPILIVLTILIIRAISKSRKDRRCILHNSNGTQDGNSRLLKETERLERNITIMLVLAAVIFTVLCLPACFFLLVYRPASDPLTNARWKLFNQVQHVCIDSSHAVNFFLYFFSSKRFRDQFIYLITCRKRPKNMPKATAHAQSMASTTKYTIAKSCEDVSHI